MRRETTGTQVRRATRLAKPWTASAARVRPTDRAGRAEEQLVARVFNRWHGVIAEACLRSSLPAEFLGALTASESGGNPRAARFEPAVYRHLKAVAAGAAAHYSGIQAEDLGAEVNEMLHPKSGEYHGRTLTAPFAANHQRALAAMEDEALRELATSWGNTQIMGYHMVGRAGTVRDLLDPESHYRVALELLAELSDENQLDLAHEFEEMFRCWNTGQPYGKTYDPDYVSNGIRRMALYRERAAAAASSANAPGGAANS